MKYITTKKIVFLTIQTQTIYFMVHKGTPQKTHRRETKTKKSDLAGTNPATTSNAMWCDDGCVMAKASADHQRWLLLLGVVLLGIWVDFMMKFVCTTTSATIEPICHIIHVYIVRFTVYLHENHQKSTIHLGKSTNIRPRLILWAQISGPGVLLKKRECSHFPLGMQEQHWHSLSLHHVPWVLYISWG